MKKSIKSKIGFSAILLILSISFLLIFLVPFKSPSMSFKSLYNKESKELVDIILDKIMKSKTSEFDENLFVNSSNISEGLLQLDEYFISNPIESFELINVKKTSFKNKNGTKRNEIFEFSTVNKEHYGYLFIEIKTVDQDIKINTIRFNPLGTEIKEMNKFYKSNFGLSRIIILIITTSLFFITVITIFDYYRSSQNPRILIMILLLISGILINIDWNTLEISTNVVAISLLPYGVFRSGNIGVWQFKLYVPILTILYWVFLKKRILKKELKTNSKIESNIVNESENITFS